MRITRIDIARTSRTVHVLLLTPFCGGDSLDQEEGVSPPICFPEQVLVGKYIFGMLVHRFPTAFLVCTNRDWTGGAWRYYDPHKNNVISITIGPSAPKPEHLARTTLTDTPPKWAISTARPGEAFGTRRRATRGGPGTTIAVICPVRSPCGDRWGVRTPGKPPIGTAPRNEWFRGAGGGTGYPGKHPEGSHNLGFGGTGLVNRGILAPEPGT